MSALGEPVDAERLCERVRHYANAGGASEEACQQMLDMLQSPLGKAVLALPQQQLDSLLVNDMYKLRMQSMYSQFMTGVSADFALKIRRITGGDSSATPATVLSDMRQQQRQVYSALMDRVCGQLQQLQPLDDRVLAALQEFHDGWQPPEAMLSRLSHNGVAPITWVDINGSPVAIGSGPIEAASNTVTSCMQAVQAAVIAAGAAKATAAPASCKANRSPTAAAPEPSEPASITPTAAAAAFELSGPAGIAPATAQQYDPSSSSAPPSSAADDPSDSTAAAADRTTPHSTAAVAAAAAAPPAGSLVLDRTERLASSLGRMVGVVEQINAADHDFDILLMAGRRSTDLLHLLLQNLYFMHHARKYIGTSSVLACALLQPLMVNLGMPLQQRQQLVKGLMGTHAHEMTSMTQQLLAGYDQEAGRRCGLKVPVCISQCLAHILFMVANGDQPPTALADTFGTAYFVRVAMLLEPPEEFLQDMQQRWGWTAEPGSKVFDLFRVWRMDSGDYPSLTQLVLDAWQQRCSERQAAGLAPLPRPRLMHSNISSVDDIRKLAALPEQLRPSTLGFGGLADGFLPFDTPGQQQQQQQEAAGDADAPDAAAVVDGVTAALAEHSLAAAAAPEELTSSPGHGRTGSVSSAISIDSMVYTGSGSSTSSAAADSSSSNSQPVTLPICSLVMKAVQAHLSVSCSSNTGSSSSSSSPIHPTTAAAAPGASEEAGDAYPYAGSLPPAAADVCGSSSSCYGSCLSESAEEEEDEQQHQHQQQQQQQQCCRMRLGTLQESAVKLGDGSSLSKAQVDPQLPAETQKEVLTRVQAMVAEGLAQLLQGHGSEGQAAALSEVLREAYVAVAREGLLNAT